MESHGHPHSEGSQHIKKLFINLVQDKVLRLWTFLWNIGSKYLSLFLNILYASACVYTEEKEENEQEIHILSVISNLTNIHR